MTAQDQDIRPDTGLVRNGKQRPGMIKLKDLLVERIDYLDTAEQLVKKYKLKSKVKFVSSNNHGDYDWESDEIHLESSFSTTAEFYLTVLHEIHHALQVKKYGVTAFMKKYNQASNIAAHHGLDPYNNNKWEKKAENWAKEQYNRYFKRGGK